MRPAGVRRQTWTFVSLPVKGDRVEVAPGRGRRCHRLQWRPVLNHCGEFGATRWVRACRRARHGRLASSSVSNSRPSSPNRPRCRPRRSKTWRASVSDRTGLPFGTPSAPSASEPSAEEGRHVVFLDALQFAGTPALAENFWARISARPARTRRHVDIRKAEDTDPSGFLISLVALRNSISGIGGLTCLCETTLDLHCPVFVARALKRS